MELDQKELLNKEILDFLSSFKSEDIKNFIMTINAVSYHIYLSDSYTKVPEEAVKELDRIIRDEYFKEDSILDPFVLRFIAQYSDELLEHIKYERFKSFIGIVKREKESVLQFCKINLDKYFRMAERNPLALYRQV